MASLGYCPRVGCGAPGVRRERRPNGNDTCEQGHEYPSREAMEQPTVFTEPPKSVRLTVLLHMVLADVVSVADDLHEAGDPSEARDRLNKVATAIRQELPACWGVVDKL
jgi:hypothetical protein